MLPIAQEASARSRNATYAAVKILPDVLISPTPSSKATTIITPPDPGSGEHQDLGKAGPVHEEKDEVDDPAGPPADGPSDNDQPDQTGTSTQ